LITRHEDDATGERRDPKITTYSQVRELRSILPNSEATRVLLDPDHSFLEALTISKRSEMSGKWRSLIASTIDSLESIGVAELKAFSSEDLEEIRQLQASTQELLDAYEKLTS